MTEALIQALCNPDVQEYIRTHEHEDVGKLVLKHQLILGIPSAVVAQQIAARKKARHKLPTWYNQPGIIYPPMINLEQASSESTAKFKQKMMSCDHAVDLTGGFGVDTFHLSRVCKKVTYVEPNESLSRIAEHNLRLLGVSNVRFNHPSTAEAFIHGNESANLLYVDPSRRTQSGKVIRLSGSEPNVVTLLPLMLRRAERILIKSSPMMDLHQAHLELPAIKNFTVLSIENECRELLMTLKDGQPAEPDICAVNLGKGGEQISLDFTWSQERSAKVAYSAPQTYIYEPNTAILKAGAFKRVAEVYSVSKLATDTHLYTSPLLISGFPGRIFRMVDRVKLSRDLKSRFDGFVNVISRNYPMSVAMILKKTGLREGGEQYLICTSSDRLDVIVADRLH